jgi:Transposase DDE domain group 1
LIAVGFVAAFDGGAVTSDAGALLLREADRAVRLIDRVAGCFSDERDQTGVVHAVHTLVGQRIIGIALGYKTSTITTRYASIRCWRYSATAWSRNARTGAARRQEHRRVIGKALAKDANPPPRSNAR